MAASRSSSRSGSASSSGSSSSRGCSSSSYSATTGSSVRTGSSASSNSGAASSLSATSAWSSSSTAAGSSPPCATTICLISSRLRRRRNPSSPSSDARAWRSASGLASSSLGSRTDMSVPFLRGWTEPSSVAVRMTGFRALGGPLAAELLRQAQLGIDRPLAGERRAHGQVVDGGGYVVHAQDRRARIHAGPDGRERACLALARRASRERADEVLARDRQQDRSTEFAQAIEPTQHLDRLRRRLREVGTRVDDDPLLVHPALPPQRYAFAHELDDIGHHVVVVRDLLPFRPPPRLHPAQPRLGVRARAGQFQI